MQKRPAESRAPLRLPELLAPAGDRAALAAALAAGADAVYFGLADGFNARARADNFGAAQLREIVAQIHRSGARAYLTLNTLVFESELEQLERLIVCAAEAGIDALIAQDPAVLLIARARCPSLELHASTQMTISSAEGARFAQSLGATRFVVPRELSIAEIAVLAQVSPLELEVFVHGALCVAWSGQCLTSAAWSGRSANRGECAQSCRMPYELVVDGALRELGDVRYLLSPKDLAGLRAVDALREIGVHGLKIEGRQKQAQYVYTATGLYRRWLDAQGVATAELRESQAQDDLLRTSLAYTRGFGDGFLGGVDHQSLVEGRFPKHRGCYLGKVRRVEGRSVLVDCDGSGRPWTGALASAAERDAPLGQPLAALRGLGGSAIAATGPEAAPLVPRAGMGVVFDCGEPEDPHEAGGPIFAVEPLHQGYRLSFGQPGPDLSRVASGARVWVTSDPLVLRESERAVRAAEPEGRIALKLSVRGKLGEPLQVTAEAGCARAELCSRNLLSAARQGGLKEGLLQQKLCAFGGTPFRLDTLVQDALEPALNLPPSELKAMRRELVALLLPQIERGRVHPCRKTSVLPELRSAQSAAALTRPAGPLLVPLCRSEEQLEAAILEGATEVELDWMELVGLARALARARAAGLKVCLATLRVQKPGEEGFDQRLAALEPDSVLVRHWGALVHFQTQAQPRPLLHGDFSLNVTNSLTARALFERGLSTLTLSHDLDRRQIEAFLEHCPAERCTLVLHCRMPTFHTEHCVYAHLLSQGRDYRSCGRPCESHQIALRDGRGQDHPVIVDAGCRNTVFDGRAQSSAELVPELLARGLWRFRVEFVRESRSEARQVLRAYQALLSGASTPAEAQRCALAHGQVGLSAQGMRTL